MPEIIDLITDKDLAQLVENKLIDFSMDYNELFIDKKFIIIKIRKTEMFKIYSYIREINRIFKHKFQVRRKSYYSDEYNYYIPIQKKKLSNVYKALTTYTHT